MAYNAYKTSQETEVLSAGPLELIRILYRTSLDSVTAARRHLLAGEIRERSAAINKACAALQELLFSVDRDRGGDIAVNLLSLYDYMHRRLIEANIQQSDAPLAEVQSLLATLLEGWQAAERQIAEECHFVEPVFV